MTDSARAHDDFHADALPGSHDRGDRIQRGRKLGHIGKGGSNARSSAHLLHLCKMSRSPRCGRLARWNLLQSRTLGHSIDAEYVDRHLVVLQELDGFLQLDLVLVGEGKSGVGRDEAVIVDPASDVAGIVAVHERHVAIGALHGLGRIVKRARPLSRHAAGLPRVVVIETSKPPVIVDRLVQVDLVAGRAKLRGVLPMEVLDKSSAVRFRVNLHEKVVQPSQDRVVTGGEIVQGRVSDQKAAVAHGVLHF